MDDVRGDPGSTGRMALLGDLIAGVAHEINTPLGALHANQDVLVRTLVKLRAAAAEVGGGAARDKLLELIGCIEDLSRVNSDAIDRMMKLASSLKTFARHDESTCEVVDIHARLDDSITLLGHLVRNRIDIVREYGDDVPLIECYPARLNQVFLNLLVNAVHAIEGRGRIVVRTSLSGDEVRVDISDTGRGMSPDVLAHIFEPGFTTKGIDAGTGLGLSISMQIVKQHGGRIEVQSTAGRGSMFSIIVPTYIPSAERMR